MKNGLHKFIALDCSHSFAKPLQKRLDPLELWSLYEVSQGIDLGRGACDRGNGAGVDAI
jgi:hypothetical protein